MRAIVVDDEKLALESLRMKLSRVPRISEVRSFLSPEEALDCFAEQGADIAFLDISMARMNGLTLAERMRELLPGVLVVFVTGYSEYALDALRLHADGYLMKPIDESDIERELDALERLRQPPKLTRRVRVQCFGDFELRVGGRVVGFTRSKSKEMLAYLVDRRGAGCPAAQIAAALWDDGVYDRSRQKQLGVIRAELLKTLRQAGAENIVDSARDAMAVRPDAFDCDYYRAMAGDREAQETFTGEYMSSYSWAELTVAELTGLLRKR